MCFGKGLKNRGTDAKNVDQFSGSNAGLAFKSKVIEFEKTSGEISALCPKAANRGYLFKRKEICGA